MKKLFWVLNLIFALTGDCWSADWIPIGGPFGSHHEFQFGVDKLAGFGGCIVDERYESQFIGGPCIDPLVIKRYGETTFTLGGGVLYNAEHGNPTYVIQPGFMIGPVIQAGIQKTAERVPYLASLADIPVPKFVQYIGSITRVQISFGYRPHSSPDIGHVCKQKTGLPFDCTGGIGIRFDGTDAVEYVGGLLVKGLGYDGDHQN